MDNHGTKTSQALNTKKVGEPEGEDELILSDADLAAIGAGVAQDSATRTMAMQWVQGVRGQGADIPQAYRLIPESPAMLAANAASHRAHGRPAYYPMWRRGNLSDPGFLREIRELNARGYGVFGSANYIRLEGADDAYKGKDGRRAVVPLGTPMCLVVDIDFGAPLRDLDTIPCTLQVQSSTPGKLHHYLRCAPGTTHAQWSAMQWALVAYLGGDPAVTDLSRAIRVPGFLHSKKSPILSTVLRADLDVEIDYKGLKAFLDGVGAGYLLQLGEAEISRRYRPLYGGRVAGLISDADLLDLSTAEAVELGKRVSAYQQAVSAADKFRAKHKSWAGLVPDLDFASGSPEAWGKMTAACNGAERALYMAGLQDRIRKHNSFIQDPSKHIAEPYQDGRWLSSAAEAALMGEMAGVELPEGAHPFLALLFSARPYASRVLGWARQAWGEYQAGRAVPQFDVGAVYSSDGWAADTSEDFGEDWTITLASGDVLTLAQIRDGALGTDDFVSAFCPWHDNTQTPAATVRLGKNGQVICHCHGGCDPASRRSGRLVPLALRSVKKADLQGVEWIGEGSFEGAAQKPEVSRYLAPIVRHPKTKLIAIHAPTGSGKTTRTMDLIEGVDRVIYVAPTQALSYSGAALISGVSHLDALGGTITAPRVATTIDSLWRVDVAGEIVLNDDGTSSNFGWGGVLVLDEWDQIEQRLFLDPRISRKAAEVRGVLQRAIAGADLVIIASAHLDAGHLARFVEMGAYTPEMVQVECLPEGAPEAHTGRPMTFFGAMGQAIERVVELLGDGEKVAVPCTEKQFAESLGAHLQQLYPAKKGIVIHGEGSPEDIATLRNVGQGWKDADYVIYNGKCGSGVSFSAPDHFHTVMIAHDVLGIGANALLQLAHRIRHPKSWSAWIGSSARAESDRTTYTAEEIVQGKVAEAARLAYLQNRYIIRDPDTGAAYCVGAGDDPVCRHGAAVQAAHMQACLDPRGDMIRELRRQGAVLLQVAAPDEGTDDALDLEALSDLFRSLRRQIRDGKVLAALSSTPLTQDELVQAKKAQTTTPEERAQQAAATVLNRYGKAGIVDGYISPELIDDALRHSNTWTSRQRLALLCLGLAGREDVLVRREVRNGVAGGAWALDGSSTRILTWRKLLTALGGLGGVTVETVETTEQDLDVSYIREVEHSLPSEPVYDGPEGVRVLKTLHDPEILNNTPTKVSLNLQIQSTWTAQSIAASPIPELLRQLIKGIPRVSLGGSLAADIKHGRYLQALNSCLRSAGIPIVSKMRGKDRVMHCSVDQDTLATALQQAERYALGLLGGVPAPIESFDPRITRLEESADVVDLLASFDAPTPTPTPTSTPTPKKHAPHPPHPLNGIEEALLAAKKASTTLRVSYAKDNPYAPSGTWTPPTEELWEVIVEAFGA